MAEVATFSVKVEEGVQGREGSPSKGPVYRSIYGKNGFPPLPEGLSTTWDIFARAVERGPGNNLLGVREMKNGKAGRYQWQTYQQVYDDVIRIGAAMRQVGVNPRGRCGIYGMNCPQWFIAMEACNAHSIVCVPLYDTLGSTAVEYISNHAEISIAFAQEGKLSLMIQSLPNCTGFLKTLVSFESISNDHKAQAQNAGVNTYTWEEFLNLGASHPVSLTPPTKEDLSTIMYTSGTTGEPKGVMLTHENVLVTIAGLDHMLKSLNEVMDHNDVYFSFLPLAHIFDRVTEEMFVFVGGSIGFWQGDIKKVPEDIAELRPTLFVGVPRVFDRLTAAIQGRIAAASRTKSLLFNLAYSNKLWWMKNGYKQDKASPLFDKLVFNKVRMGLGGRVRLVISGAAPLAGHVEEFLRVIMCAPVLQGYGLTETCAASFIQMPDVISMSGTVGPSLCNIETRLESVPELGYDALDKKRPRGEICIRGKTVFSGYYKRPELTEEVLVDGWFHTGDIGEWQADGSMKIIDRKKNIFKLSQGEYIAVEKLENVYNQSAAVDAIWVYGNSFESSMVAVAVPNEQVLLDWAKSNGKKEEFAALCKIPEAQKFILSELSSTGKKSGVRGFEFIKGVLLDPQPFDMERDLITPTYKLKRPQLLKHYQKDIDALYTTIRSNS
ncbi:long chain acyl-CoA synthetase 4 isoform X1 [Physcomitrium patens]|uniref:Long-chain-fatty-acid--CoA ligase n=2 Tax=Physcomitrium patens TaxID=3218 RepID=A0A2K1JRJ0_PHYPA|nr:long chain acyl-CoA synthetase 4-like isoform X1 [Physcomitrium patens]XP_024391454.1 long chain acyl-CoA synthetase 4-like isoform X1 [Physcomitrium patens]XP_024391455.1 long chain acyl-CoA synthetase 4-like isoform X1 [Physcomitrium patens]XP_024391456.1 long chain acyl-CoA synthetase 4-like isoform X1 [Physcomitrium patens]PNR44152.1 hypothetical protein PHYPA_016536 [Physcomitrium patens]|eukprot:XP_024391453.1 long chain acyl-CoA synthetase 4-like isoform X1 [Physcomitrella patens]